MFFRARETFKVLKRQKTNKQKKQKKKQKQKKKNNTMLKEYSVIQTTAFYGMNQQIFKKIQKL